MSGAKDPGALLRASYAAALAAADPAQMLARHLPPPPAGKTIVVGAGKAAASMAAAVERAYGALAPERLSGLVVTRYGHGLPTQRIRVVEAGHPVPDAAGAQAAQDILDLARSAGPQDRLLALISGGGSSLLSLPVPSVPVADLQATTRELLRCGAPIGDMNVVRKHLSQVQGGRLAAAAAQSGAEVLALIVSDVTGDRPSDIGSGPCTPDPSTYADALAVLARWGAKVPESVSAHLQAGARGEIAETPKPGDAAFARVQNKVIATARGSLLAGAECFCAEGVRPVILGDTVTGEARDVASTYAALVREIREHGEPFATPVALISGGECTVTIPAGKSGRGGRCSEFLLSLALELDGMDGVHAIAADTDGIDGSEDNAGAILDPRTVARAASAGWPARKALDDHDAWGFFDAAGGLVSTGPTLTNVNDYRAILIL
ncbi:MAG: glycerate kinase [Candidatus Protistobacter heckmanni]|nr:glycerate kinase [Candidatus Protistobacter heckmanni]